MKGVSKYYTPGIVDVKALLRNDILLFSENVPEYKSNKDAYPTEILLKKKLMIDVERC